MDADEEVYDRNAEVWSGKVGLGKSEMDRQLSTFEQSSKKAGKIDSDQVALAWDTLSYCMSKIHEGAFGFFT
jgi:hypothetical protein